MGIRFANGSDPEPWRCRRTDGKKWRCAKECAPDLRYCEKHSHKTRSRSRKPVESQSRNTKDNPTIPSTANQQTKCSDLFMKNDLFPLSQSNNRFEQPILKGDQLLKQDSKGNHQHKSYLLDRNNPYINTTGDGGIGAWSTIGKSVDDCSLTLSMQSGGSGIEFDDESFQMAARLLNLDRNKFEDVYKPQHQWVNQDSWASSGSTPGGPLGEALCLGIAGTTNSPQSEVFPHHGYSNSTTTSGSCEGGGDHGFSFIR
nr:growth-regulating factor 8-like [Tanacetum cinerariifolium]